MIKKRTFAAVGTGSRIPMFIYPIADTYRETCELVGMCDPSETRRVFHQRRLDDLFAVGLVPTYSDFDEMLKACRPDVVIVCTPDYLHHEFIVKSLEFGADVISEKPLTTDALKCRAILDAVKRTGRSVRTTFNLRWTPGATKVRELIAQGTIGRVRHVDFEYQLNTSHGADYFRRWHSHKEFSGGLLVHKSTHHFDLINWWIDAIPKQVFAMGDLVFYGRKNALERGDGELTRYPRYTGMAEAKGDPFRLALDEEKDVFARGLYLNAEAETGYIRDRNVFRDGIDIEDSMSVLIKYRTGEMAAYSLNAYCPNEGFRVSLSGDRGRIEYVEKYDSHILGENGEAKPDPAEHSRSLRVQKMFSEPYDVEIANVEGGHGGGDTLLREQIFSPSPPSDVLGRSAGHEQGAASMLVGAAGNLSISTGQPVQIDELLELNPAATRLHELC
jgi:predicted dehydrogenase